MRLLSAGAAVSVLLPAMAAAQTSPGFYLGAGAGLNLMTQLRETATLTIDNPFGASITRSGRFTTTPDPGWVVLGSLGWGFGNGLRAEIEGSSRSNGLDAAIGVPALRATGSWRQSGVMVNLLYDLPVGAGWVQPYLGAGIGAQWRSGELFDGFGTRSLGTGGARFAYQAILGIAMPVPGAAGLHVTAEYRFLGLAGDQTTQGTGTISACAIPEVSFGNIACDRPDLRAVAGSASLREARRLEGGFNHAVMLGLRLGFPP
ncbi:MAG: porin family protein [Acetobacteraceae bacterium]|nr:porin family protein [Acetobacteraceae bacterium]